MRSNQLPAKQGQVPSEIWGPFGEAMEYIVDAGQRTVLFWDVMRQRGNQYSEHLAQTVPHVLSYEAELIIDGRTLPRPVNYGLVRIVPPKGVTIDPQRRPFVIVDPRAGHGPGIGGFKADSEIGVAFKAGHPCYFVGFLPEPMPGQTIEDIARAEYSPDRYTASRGVRGRDRSQNRRHHHPGPLGGKLGDALRNEDLG